MSKVRYSQHAAFRLRDIARFYHAKEPGLELRVMQQIAASLNALAENPRAGRPFAEDPTYRERVIPFGRGSFLALYSIEGDGSNVIASIKHAKEQSYGLRVED